MKTQLHKTVLLSTLIMFGFSKPAFSQWTDLNSGVTNDLNGVSFINTTTGWIAGRQGTIIKTVDNGSNWLAENSATTEDLNAIHMLSSTVGYAVGKNGKVSKYNGATWAAANTGESMDVFGVYFLTANSGWAVGDWGRLYYTSNGGASWVNQNTDGFAAYKYNDVHMLDASTGWAVGTGGRIVKFNGTSWVTQTSGVTTELLGAHFLNANFGFAVGKNSTMLFYNGTSWTTQNPGLGNTNDNIYDVHIISTTEAYAVVSPGFGGAGVILKYNGTTWTKDYEFSGVGSELFYGIHFPSSSKGYAVGAGGIIKTVDLGPSGISEMNPNAGNVKIYYTPLNEKLFVQLDNYTNATAVIYSLEGKLVHQAFLVSSNTEINVSDLVKGIYFAQVKGSEGITTKKLIIN